MVGTYTLKSVDGVALPAPIKDPATGAVVATITAGTVTFASTNTYSSSLNYTVNNVPQAAIVSSGTWSQNGAVVTLTSAGSSPVSATWSAGNTIAATVNAQMWVFKK